MWAGVRLAQPGQIRQPQQGGRLAPGQNQGTHVGQLLGAPHEHSVMAQRIDKTGVLDDASLEREDADSHQPRSARRWGAGRSATLMPTMASPRAREARRTTAGSS